MTQEKKAHPKNSAELIAANKELAFQVAEREKRAEELKIANAELAFQNEEKEKRAAELVIANRELAFQNKEKEKRAAELIIANKELSFQNQEKEIRAMELNTAYNELKKAEEFLKEYVLGLEEMMFITSHKVRQPIANIIGISRMIEQSIGSPRDLKKMIDYIKESALSLDTFTKELTKFMSDLEKKGKYRKADPGTNG